MRSFHCSHFTDQDIIIQKYSIFKNAVIHTKNFDPPGSNSSNFGGKREGGGILKIIAMNLY